MAVRWNKGSRLLLKGTLLIIIGVALFSVINYSLLENTSNNQGFNTEGNEVALEKRALDDLAPLVLLPQYKNPCFNTPHGNGFRCIPLCHVIGIGPSAESLVHAAIQHNTKVIKVPENTNDFFAKFLDLDQNIGDAEIQEYASQYNGAAARIQNSNTGDDLIFCDRGNYLARTYVTSEEHPFSIEYTVPAFLHHMDNDTKLIVVLRHPIDRIYAEYCKNGNNPDSFSDAVDEVLPQFERCLTTFSRTHCIYSSETIISGVNIARSMYGYLLDDLAEVSDDRGNTFIVHFDELTDPTKINGIMSSVFEFLEITPDEFDFSIWLTGGELCDGVPMSATTRGKLEVFLEGNIETAAQNNDDTKLYYWITP